MGQEEIHQLISSLPAKPEEVVPMTVERIDIPNGLNREFDMYAPNHACRGDITYVGARERWHYLAAVLDLFACRVVAGHFLRIR